MVRRLFSFFLFYLTAMPVSAQPELEALSAALDAYSRGELAEGSEFAQNIEDPIALDLLSWTRLRRGEGDFAEYIGFLDRNPDWPGLPYLRRQGEPSIPEGADPASVLDYFIDNPPQTGAGALAFARALEATGNRPAAHAEVIRAWTSLVMTGTQAQALNRAYGSILTEDHHIARLDHLLWEGAEDRARAMFSLVPEGWVALAEARLALRERRAGVDGLIEAVPADLQNHPGLAYERFLWRMAEGLWDSAGELMAAHSTSAEALGRPAAWGRRRADLARDVMREGDHAQCYDYASTHRVTPEEDYLRFADLEWIAGYCALQMGRAETAVQHFSDFREVVFSPISLGRPATGWVGRTKPWAMIWPPPKVTRWGHNTNPASMANWRRSARGFRLIRPLWVARTTVIGTRPALRHSRSFTPRCCSTNLVSTRWQSGSLPTSPNVWMSGKQARWGI